MQYVAVNSVHPFEKKLSHVQLSADRKTTPLYSEFYSKSGANAKQLQHHHQRQQEQQQHQQQQQSSTSTDGDNKHPLPVLLPLSVEVLVPATEIFIKHYKYLSWTEFKAQRAGE